MVEPFVERACLRASNNPPQVLAGDLDPEFSPAALFQSRECGLSRKAVSIFLIVRLMLGPYSGSKGITQLDTAPNTRSIFGGAPQQTR